MLPRDERRARDVDAEAQETVKLLSDTELASLLAKLLHAHAAILDPTTRAAAARLTRG